MVTSQVIVFDVAKWLRREIKQHKKLFGVWNSKQVAIDRTSESKKVRADIDSDSCESDHEINNDVVEGDVNEYMKVTFHPDWEDGLTLLTGDSMNEVKMAFFSGHICILFKVPNWGEKVIDFSFFCSTFRVDAMRTIAVQLKHPYCAGALLENPYMVRTGLEYSLKNC